MGEKGKCPVTGMTSNKTAAGRTNKDWWPNQLKLKMLRQNPGMRNPMGETFNYAEEFNKLDFQALKNRDLAGRIIWAVVKAVTQSQAALKELGPTHQQNGIIAT